MVFTAMFRVSTTTNYFYSKVDNYRGINYFVPSQTADRPPLGNELIQISCCCSITYGFYRDVPCFNINNTIFCKYRSQTVIYNKRLLTQTGFEPASPHIDMWNHTIRPLDLIEKKFRSI